ncbi:unnamed protein product [Urochloa humidicola]
MHRSADNFVLLLAAATFHLSLIITHALREPQSPGSGHNATVTCIAQERDALLAFKKGITSDPAGVLASWQEDERDCCRWRGIQCSNRTGHVLKLQLGNEHYFSIDGETITPLVGQISSSLLKLENLEYLDLSWNELEGSTGRIPEFLGSLKNLKYLNLSGIQFFGPSVPPQLGNLSKLQYLDLSCLGETYSRDLSWISHLSLLRYLSLEIELWTVTDWPHVLNMIPSLRFLYLSNCFLRSTNQSLSHLNLTKLEELDLSENHFDHPVASGWFWNITTLRFLDLGDSGLYGQLPHALGGMTSLTYLDLSGISSNLSLTMKTLKSLCNLRILSLDACFSNGNIADLIEELPQCSSENKLLELSLGSNHLTGNIPNLMGQFTSLVRLDLSVNNITGPLPSFIGHLTSLRFIDLSYNHLSGHVPYEISRLSNLVSLFLKNNDLDGVIKEDHFDSIRSLQFIDLSYNSLKFDLSSQWQPPFRLISADFATCQMGPLFPAWLQWQADIIEIDISSAGINIDSLPNWFPSSLPNLQYLNISNNDVKGHLPKHMENMALQELYFSSNQLTGQIPQLPPNLTHLDMSMNALSGPLPSNFCGQNLVELSLFSNNITGGIPRSICNCGALQILDVANNFLDGEFPICPGNLTITNIELSNNSFSGAFPSFLRNLRELQFLDLAGNKLSGRLPAWIGNLVKLEFLRLSHNMFSGSIPTSITNLHCLTYLDIASNGISGSLSKHLFNLTLMRHRYWNEHHLSCRYSQPIEYHSVTLSAVTKGQQLNYGSIDRLMDVNLMRIDLSSNYLSGEIPEEISTLYLLEILNLSRNNFTGNIPNHIGTMQLLESLDLSRNELSGKIPQSLSNLTFLSYLDMSYNNLTGSIPSGSQLDSLYAANPSMYTGNEGPLMRRTEGHIPDFFYLGLGCGFLVGNWVVSSTFLYKKQRRIAYFRLFDELYDRVYVFVAVTWAGLVRKPTN